MLDTTCTLRDIKKAIGDRVAELIGFPLRNAESYQVVYYTGGTEYNDHHDAFDHETEEGRKHLTRGGQRIYTALGYLNDVEEGGATEFRDLNISIPPKRELVGLEEYPTRHNKSSSCLIACRATSYQRRKIRF